MASEGGQLVIFNTADLLFSIPEEDRQGKRTMLGILSAYKLASLTELMQIVGVLHVEQLDALDQQHYCSSCESISTG